MVADYLAANRPYTPKLDGRITEIAAAAQADEPAATAPAEAAAATAAAAKPADAGAATNSHVIVAGDNFWNLAKTFYNDPTKWRAIADANPGNRPRTLQIGKSLTIPRRQRTEDSRRIGARPGIAGRALSFRLAVRPDVVALPIPQRARPVAGIGIGD